MSLGEPTRVGKAERDDLILPVFQAAHWTLQFFSLTANRLPGQRSNRSGEQYVELPVTSPLARLESSCLVCYQKKPRCWRCANICSSSPAFALFQRDHTWWDSHHWEHIYHPLWGSAFQGKSLSLTHFVFQTQEGFLRLHPQHLCDLEEFHSKNTSRISKASLVVSLSYWTDINKQNWYKTFIIPAHKLGLHTTQEPQFTREIK